MVRVPRALVRRLGGEVLRFGVVGALAYVVDAGLFNVLAYVIPSPLDPVAAKVVSVTVSTVVTWIGNRYFVFPHRRARAAAHEAALFFAFSAAGMVIAVGTLWVSHDVLGFTSAQADNIAANVVGFGLATAFRFVTYRFVVFRAPAPQTSDAAAGR